MKKIALVLFVFAQFVGAQEYPWEKLDLNDIDKIENRARLLAKNVIKEYRVEDKTVDYDKLFRLHIAAKQYELSNTYLDSLIVEYRTQLGTTADVVGIHYRITNNTRLQSKAKSQSFDVLFEKVFTENTKSLNQEAKNFLDYYFTNDTVELRNDLKTFIEKLNEKEVIEQSSAIQFVQKYVSFETYNTLGGLAKPLIEKIDNELYIIQDSLLIETSKKSKISALIVRSKEQTKKLPTILMFSIYPDGSDITQAKEMASAGYNGVVAFTRGKKNSPNATHPFEYDATDVNQVIDWISKQSWSDGQVGMYGGSYLGFTQWSATKNMHPSLKTIVPQVAVGTGIDYPMHNGVFMSYMLRWIHYVTNKKMTDAMVFRDDDKWKNTYKKWYESGKSFRALDSIEGNPNPIFQRWLDHPDFDSYWKKMTVSGKEFAKVNIPVLTFTGYYDDDQIGALYYYKEHHRHHKNPNHHLVIGPYDHFGAQGYPRPKLMGYTLDSTANIRINDMTYEWFDHILKDSIKPSFLKGRVNMQVMGKNIWRHVSSIDKVSNDTLKFFLDNTHKNGFYKLVNNINHKNEFIRYEVDFSDRFNHPENFNYEDLKIIDSTLSVDKQLAFATAPFEKDFELNGQFTGKLKFTTNKKDMDIRILFYEIKADGTFFNLSNYLGRASYNEDREKRNLLEPNKREEITIKNSTFTSRLISAGSKLLVLLSVNNNPHWQVNYGTGKDVSDETIMDAKEPLKIKWHTDSYLEFPIFKE